MSLTRSSIDLAINYKCAVHLGRARRPDAVRGHPYQRGVRRGAQRGAGGVLGERSGNHCPIALYRTVLRDGRGSGPLWHPGNHLELRGVHRDGRAGSHRVPVPNHTAVPRRDRRGSELEPQGRSRQSQTAVRIAVGGAGCT